MKGAMYYLNKLTGKSEPQEGTGGAAHVTTTFPYPQVDPTISGVPTPELEIDGVGTGTLVPHVIRVTVNPGDATTGALRLQNGYPEVFLCFPGDTIEIASDTAITNVYWVGVDYVLTAPANYTGNAYIISRDDATAGDWQANMASLVFDSADVVKKVKISMTALFNTNFARVKVVGDSHA